MFRRFFIAILLALSGLSAASIALGTPPAPSTRAVPDPPAQDFSRSIVPITSVKLRGPWVQAEFGSGFCLDPNCQFIGTNYHVAAMIGRPKIEGAKVVERYFATGPNDDGATLNYTSSGHVPLRYTWNRDLAIYQLAKPLRGYHGLQFSSEDLNIGAPVDIYAYPKGAINPFRALQIFHGVFRGQDVRGLLVFQYAPNGDQRLRPGASGGVVVDTASGKVVGIFCGLPTDSQPLAFAVPIKSLAEFLKNTQPLLAAVLFPLRAEASADRGDFYPEYRPDRSGALHRRTDSSDGSPAVRLLRERAQSLADGMRDFIAVQTYVWGTGEDHVQAADAYEVQVRGGSQKFREFPDGKRWQDAPYIPGAPPVGVTPIDDWSTLPLYIGTQVGVEIREAPPAQIDSRGIRVFQYSGSVEDQPCRTRDVLDFGLFSFHRDSDSRPYGEVWTDQHENIVRMSLHCEDRGWGWGNGETIVTYGWLAKPGVEPRLVPIAIVYKSSRGKKLYWCRGQFVNYREFASRARILTEAATR